VKYQGMVSSAANRAQSIIQEYNLRVPMEIDIEAIAALRGAYVREEVLSGCDGRLVKKGKQGIISVKKDIPEVGRRRFTIAHELGHFELHGTDGEWKICVEKDFQLLSQQANPKESEANVFAAELLMPEPMFKPLCQRSTPDLSLIETLAQEFRTSLSATALRYITFCPYRCSIVVSRASRIDWYKSTEGFGYWIERETKLDQDTLAADFFAGRKVPDTMQPVSASSWIQSPRISRLSYLKEQSWAFKNYGYVLTLLWLDDAFEKEEGDEEDEEE
jgi:hypothetical protein